MRPSRRRSALRGFTLVEVMVVVTLISVLASLSVPAVRLLKMRARTATIANDFRTFEAAFNGYAQEHGAFPAEAAAGVMPAGMSDRLNSTAWLRPTPMGGRYNWENNQMHWGDRIRAAIAITATPDSPLPLDVNQLLDLDRKQDDGILFRSGSFRIGAGLNPLWVILQ